MYSLALMKAGDKLVLALQLHVIWFGKGFSIISQLKNTFAFK